MAGHRHGPLGILAPLPAGHVVEHGQHRRQRRGFRRAAHGARDQRLAGGGTPCVLADRRHGQYLVRLEESADLAPEERMDAGGCRRRFRCGCRCRSDVARRRAGLVIAVGLLILAGAAGRPPRLLDPASLLDDGTGVAPANGPTAAAFQTQQAAQPVDQSRPWRTEPGRRIAFGAHGLVVQPYDPDAVGVLEDGAQVFDVFELSRRQAVVDVLVRVGHGVRTWSESRPPRIGVPAGRRRTLRTCTVLFPCRTWLLAKTAANPSVWGDRSTWARRPPVRAWRRPCR